MTKAGRSGQLGAGAPLWACPHFRAIPRLVVVGESYRGDVHVLGRSRNKTERRSEPAPGAWGSLNLLGATRRLIRSIVQEGGGPEKRITMPGARPTTCG